MIYWFNSFRDTSLLAIFLKMLFVLICGGLIGLERGFKRRAAGFRTHILICLGAAITTMTSQHLLLDQHYNTDIARLGAQVIAGVGPIVAGTIIVTRQQRVKGLTTAAGIWVTAIIGLTIGAGFFEAAIVTTILILFTEITVSKIEHKMLLQSYEINLYIEYIGKDVLNNILVYLREHSVSVIDFEIVNRNSNSSDFDAAILLLKLPRKKKKSNTFNASQIHSIQGVISVLKL